MLSRKLSDRVKIQTTYQGRPDKGEEAPLEEPAVQRRLRARWMPGDRWRPGFSLRRRGEHCTGKQARNRRRAAPAVRPLHDESRACGDANTSRSRMSKPPPPCHPGRVLRPPRGRTVSDSPSGLYFIYHLGRCCSGPHM